MPTKQEILDYLDKDHRHSMYSASLHFGVEITELYKIVKEK